MEVTLKNKLKGVFSIPFRWIFGSGTLQEAQKIGLLIRYPGDIALIDPRITLIESYPEDLKHIELPRYISFTQALIDLSDLPNLEILNIAGNNIIQVDAYRLPEPLSGCEELYQIPAEEDLVAYEVQVENLLKVLNQAKSNVIFIHDY